MVWKLCKWCDTYCQHNEKQECSNCGGIHRNKHNHNNQLLHSNQLPKQHVRKSNQHTKQPLASSPNHTNHPDHNSRNRTQRPNGTNHKLFVRQRSIPSTNRNTNRPSNIHRNTIRFNGWSNLCHSGINEMS